MRKIALGLIVALVALVAIGAAPVATAQSGQPYNQRWLFASDFGTFTIRSQTSATYSWSPGSICNVPAGSSAQSFFAFATTQPVEIVDFTNTALNEIVTPTAVTNTASICSIAVSPANTHYGFYVTSGTGGLQEAINSVSSTAPYPVMIWIDRNWYALANALPGTTPAKILAALTGNANAVIVDNTTQPFTYYTYNGTGYSGSGTTVAFPNLKVSSYTNIAAPTALSTSATTGGIITTSSTGGTIGNAGSTYRLGATCVDASGGETTLSIDTASAATIATGTSTSTNSINVTSPVGCTTANGAVGWRLYMSAASGASLSEILYSPTCSSTSVIANQSVFVPATVCPIGASATITAIVTGTATVPSVNTAFPRLAGSSGSWPPFPALGTVASAATGTLGVINVPSGYFNVLGRSVMACGNAYATQNGTGGGTLALKLTVSSIPGVTTITPLTLTSGAPTLSTQDPINFCITITTASTGTTGTLWVHGWMGVGLAGTGPMTTYNDLNFAVSSAVDLTKQDQLALTITPTTTGLTAAQITQFSIYPSN
jgi:hypothetical protein